MISRSAADTESTSPSVLVVMGVCGTGKSTVAGLLADRLGWRMAEGDDLHPAANVAKMAAGHPLTDEDRWPWLDRVGSWIRSRTQAGSPGIITCSALRRVYRNKLRGPGVVFVHLDGARDEIADLMSHRAGHFMPLSLLDSQLETLEPLEDDEAGLVVSVDQTPEEEVVEIIRRLALGDTRSDGQPG
ncbi:MAG: gluconokinase [Microlunatus sp.]|nr:gluconokinase [Microlunatus sp.]